jgi:adenosine deaminase
MPPHETPTTKPSRVLARSSTTLSSFADFSQDAAGAEFCQGLPKAELHLHIEGSLEPELMMRLAQRNKVDIPYKTVEDVIQAYQFDNLQEFLDVYYQGAAVLVTAADF